MSGHLVVLKDEDGHKPIGPGILRGPEWNENNEIVKMKAASAPTATGMMMTVFCNV